MVSPIAADGPRCGAHSRRTGEPCKNHVMRGKKRCKFHGGMSTGAPLGNKNAVTFGLYARGLLPHEVEAWASVPVGTLDAEIKLTRLLLDRAVELQRRFIENPNDPALLELLRTEVSSESSPGAPDATGKRPLQTDGEKRAIVKSRPDLDARIYRLTGRLATLEQARIKIRASNPETPPSASDDARQDSRKAAMADIERLMNAPAAD